MPSHGLGMSKRNQVKELRMQTTTATERPATRPRYKSWKYVLDTCNPPPEGLLDFE